MIGIAALFTQTASVETYQGSGAYGDVFADAVDKSCFVNDSIKLVRDSQGQEVVSTARLYAPIGDVDDYKPGSKVTINGATRLVIVAARRDAAGPVSVHHAEIQLT